MSTTTVQSDGIDATSRPSWWRWAIAVTAVLGAVMEIIDTSIVNVALTHMQASFGATVSEIGWTITGYAMANVIMIPLSAWLGDVFGKKNYFIFCLIGFTLASILCGLSINLPMMIAARILQGLAGGGLLAKAQGILFETFPKEEQGFAQALFGIGVMVGPALGPVLGGYITDNYGWPWIFFINIPFGILASLAAFTFFPQDKKKSDVRVKQKVDWFGILFLAIGLGSLQIFLEEGNREEWFQSPFIVFMAIAAVVGLVLFVWQELTIDYPAVDLRVLRYRSLAAGSVYSMVLGIGLFGSVFAIPIYAQSVLQLTASQTGLLLFPSAVASAMFMMVSTYLAQRFDARWTVFLGSMIMGASLFALAHINPNMGQESFFWPNIFRGIGTVLMFMPLTLATLSTIPKKDVHKASGFFNLTRQIGGSIGIAGITTFLDQRLNFHRSVLVDHVSMYDPMVRQQIAGFSQAFAASSPGVAQTQAIALMDRMVMLQATILSYGDVFWCVGSLLLLSCVLIIFLGSGKTDPSVTLETH